MTRVKFIFPRSMSVIRDINEVIDFTHKIDLLPHDVDNTVQLLGLLLFAKKEIVEGCKSGSLTEGAASRLNGELDAFLKRPIVKHTPKEMSTSVAPATPRNAIGDSKRKVSVMEPGRIEEDMLRLTSDMREAAVGVQSTLKRDRTVLEMTSKLQDDNMNQTRSQVSSAVDARKARRLSLWMTIFMVLSSLVIFLALIPIILVT
jgi:hypothetical protein